MIGRSLLVGLALLPLPVLAQQDLETFTGKWLYEIESLQQAWPCRGQELGSSAP
jgi:hypothetical protein